MRVSTLFGSAVLLGVSYVAASDVLDLTGDNFDVTVGAEDLMLVEFFAPWCGHCKALAPQYEEAATSLKEKGIKLAKVDCVDQADLCQQHGVTGYPTLKVSRKGEFADYGGPRKADGIVSYMLKQNLPAISEVKLDNHEEFKTADRVVVVAYFPSSTDAPASAFSQVAERHRDDYLFGMVTDEETIKAAGVEAPAVVIYKSFDEGRNDFPSKGIKDTTPEVLDKFIQDASLPLLAEVNGDNYATYSGTGYPLAYVFVDPADEGKDALIEELKPVAAAHKGAINFVWIDAVKYVDHGKSLNLKADKFPAFVVTDIVGGLKYPMNDVAVTKDSVAEFVSKFAAGTLEPTLKSEPIPEQTEPVTVVVGKTYEQIVHDDSKDVFVELYAPWCGHCKRLKPTWDELGEHFAPIKDKVTIAKMDATENDLPKVAPFKVSGFPTIKFKPAGSKDFVDYEGDRSLDSLIAFVKEHAKNDVTVPEKKTVAEEASSTQVSATETPDAHAHEEL